MIKIYVGITKQNVKYICHYEKYYLLLRSH